MITTATNVITGGFTTDVTPATGGLPHPIYGGGDFTRPPSGRRPCSRRGVLSSRRSSTSFNDPSREAEKEVRVARGFFGWLFRHRPGVDVRCGRRQDHLPHRPSDH